MKDYLEPWSGNFCLHKPHIDLVMPLKARGSLKWNTVHCCENAAVAVHTLRAINASRTMTVKIKILLEIFTGNTGNLLSYYRPLCSAHALNSAQQSWFHSEREPWHHGMRSKVCSGSFHSSPGKSPSSACFWSQRRISIGRCCCCWRRRRDGLDRGGWLVTAVSVVTPDVLGTAGVLVPPTSSSISCGVCIFRKLYALNVPTIQLNVL